MGPEPVRFRDQVLTKSEFFDKDGGLLQFVRSRLLDLDSEPPPVRAQRSWNLYPGQWFKLRYAV